MEESTRCIIVRGGPAGMVAGLLLARSGVPVTVLEKHADFLRDFRGDTIHPSTLRLLDEIGLMSEFEKIDFSKVSQASIPASDGSPATVLDLSRMKHPFPFIAMAPQWDFLNLLAHAGDAEPNFELRMSTSVTGVVAEGGRIVGVKYETSAGSGEMRALLTIAADGRWSRVRETAALPMRDFSVPIDVWWFKIPSALDRKSELTPAFAKDRSFVLIPRKGYVQAAMLLRKGHDAQLRAEGVHAWRRSIIQAAPELEGSVQSLALDDAKLMDVKLNRAKRWWRRGLLCIGDSAHAMSPVGGIGINLAVQDAVATARILAQPLREGTISDHDVAAVQRRRTVPTVATQMAQRVLHRGLTRVMESNGDFRVPMPIAAAFRVFPKLTALPARLLGVGVLRERPPIEACRWKTVKSNKGAVPALRGTTPLKKVS